MGCQFSGAAVVFIPTTGQPWQHQEGTSHQCLLLSCDHEKPALYICHSKEVRTDARNSCSPHDSERERLVSVKRDAQPVNTMRPPQLPQAPHPCASQEADGQDKEGREGGGRKKGREGGRFLNAC